MEEVSLRACMKKNIAHPQVRIISPNIFPQQTWNEAEVMGAMLWLWAQKKPYASYVLDESVSLIQQIIDSRNFALFIVDSSPIGYINWAYLPPQAQAAYTTAQQPYAFFVNYDTPSTDTKLWILSFFCVTGTKHARLMQRVSRDILFKNQPVHWQYHKPERYREMSAHGTRTY